MAYTPIHSLDEEGYVFVSRSASCAIRTAYSEVQTPSGNSPPTPIPRNVQGSPTNLEDRLRIYVKNAEDEHAAPPNRTVYLGGPGVSTQNGYPLEPSQEVIFELGDKVQLYAIKTADATGTITLRTIELS